MPSLSVYALALALEANRVHRCICTGVYVVLVHGR